MDVQKITTENGDRLVVLAEADYLALVRAAEDLADSKAVAAFRRKLEAGEEELVPSEIVDRILNGESRIKVWREHRGLTSKALADRAGIAQGFLSQIETGRREGTIDTLLKIAAELHLAVDDLVEQKNVRIERLINVKPGMTVAEIAQEVHASESHVRRVCDWLCDEKIGRAYKNGIPHRFYPCGGEAANLT